MAVVPANSQLPVDFEAPSRAAWFFKFTEASSAQQIRRARRHLIPLMQLATGLVKNGLDYAQALLYLYKDNRQLFDVAASQQEPEAAFRLARLLMYYERVAVGFDLATRGLARTISGGLRPRKKWTTLLDSFSACLDALPKEWNSRFKKSNSDKQPGIPSEPMTELLAQVSIWVQERSGNPPANIDDAETILRGMVASNLSSGADVAGRLGMCQVLFCTYATGPPTPRLVVGSSAGIYEGDLKHIFQCFLDARTARFTEFLPGGVETTSDELRNRWVGGDKRRMELYWNEAKRCPGLRADLVAQAVVVVDKIRDSDKNWGPFDHSAQVSQAFWCFGRGQDGSFSRAARCKKCRIIHDYDIAWETSQELNKSANVNAGLSCAEDMAHAKLRVMVHNGQPTPLIVPRQAS